MVRGEEYIPTEEQRRGQLAHELANYRVEAEGFDLEVDYIDGMCGLPSEQYDEASRVHSDAYYGVASDDRSTDEILGELEVEFPGWRAVIEDRGE